MPICGPLHHPPRYVFPDGKRSSAVFCILAQSWNFRTSNEVKLTEEMKRFEVKVCGITTEEGVEACIQEGVDWVGLNFVPQSSRYVDLQKAAILQACARHKVRVVGVFQNPRPEHIRSVLSALHLDAVQLHGEEPPEFCAQVPVPVWKVFSIHPGWDASALHRYKGLAVRLFDTFHGGQSGGTGRVFNWALLPSNPPRPWFLAGGLNPDNLNAAVSTTYPDGVDLNSGVESAPGIKDPALLKRAMTILARWREGASNGISNAPAITQTILDGIEWSQWSAPEDFAVLDENAILALQETHTRLVLDFRKCGDCASKLGQFMRLQMQAKSKGYRLRFRFNESTISALMRISMISALDILE